MVLLALMNVTNIGTSQTVISTPGSGPDRTNEISWHAEYDGKRADVLIESSTDGNKQYSELTFTNAELENLSGAMNFPKKVGRLDTRLEQDYMVQNQHYGGRSKKIAFTHPFAIRSRAPKKYPATPKRPRVGGGSATKRARKTRRRKPGPRARNRQTRRRT